MHPCGTLGKLEGSYDTRDTNGDDDDSGVLMFVASGSGDYVGDYHDDIDDDGNDDDGHAMHVYVGVVCDNSNVAYYTDGDGHDVLDVDDGGGCSGEVERWLCL